MRLTSCSFLLFALSTSILSAASFSVTNNADNGPGTLRQAILDANAAPGPDVIQFNIAPGGLQTISLTNDLPAINDPVTIDGTTQPGFAGQPVIEVMTPLTDMFAPYYGLQFNSSSNIVRGLIVNRVLSIGLQFNTGSSGNLIEGNWIGTDATGTLDFGMTYGIYINGGSNNIIGGTAITSRNVISGGAENGVHIAYGTRNTVLGNYIGTDIYGTNEIGNGWARNGDGNWAAGVWIEGGGSNTVGGTAPGAANLISGNVRGVILYNSTTNNLVVGNMVGLNAAGTARLSGRGQETGVWIYNSFNNVVGGTNAAARNVISGNGRIGSGAGVRITGGAWNLVEGNYIGTDVAGTTSVTNMYPGIYLDNTRSNTIGGTVAGTANVISGNLNDGVYLWLADSNLIQGNYIGTQADGSSPLGNGESGIYIYNANGNTIGGSTAAAGNVIAFNGKVGVAVTSDGTAYKGVNNLIRRNSMFSNGDLGIRLGNNVNCSSCPSYNDNGDTDSGPNDMQNFPVLLTATTSGGTITINGSLNSLANASFTLDFYSSPMCDASGFGEGKRWIGSYPVTTDGSGNATFNATLAATGVSGQFISATATDVAKNTSEFSSVVIADNSAGVLQLDWTDFWGSEGSSYAQIVVSRFGGTNGTVSVEFATSNGTATAGLDYIATNGFLTFLPGETIKFFNIPIIDDALNETAETVNISLSNATGGALLGARTNGTMTLQDNDAVSIRISDAAASQAGPGTNVVVFGVTLSVPSVSTVAVDYATADLTAAEGVDYANTSGRLYFPPGTTNQFLAVPVYGTETPEGTKLFSMFLSNATNATLSDSQGVGTIYDGTQGLLQFASATYSVSEGSSVATIAVQRVGGALGTISISYNTANGTAIASSDYTAASGTLTFTNGQTSNSFTIPIANDAVNEDNETVGIHLTNPVNTVPGMLSDAVLTILDDDPLPALSAGSLSAFEGNSGVTPFVVTIRLIPASGRTVTVDFSTVDGTATSGSDYVATNGTLVFAPGQTNQTVTVLVNGDPEFEGDETLSVALSNPTNASISVGAATVTIRDDEPAPQVQISPNDIIVPEGNAGTTNVTFQVALSAALPFPVGIDYFTGDGSGRAGADYLATSGTLIFSPGERTNFINVPVIGDTVFEPEEYFILYIQNNATNRVSIATPYPYYSIAHIENDDLPPLTIQRGATNVAVLWPYDAYGFQLQSTTNLASPDWQAVTNQMWYVNGQYCITNSSQVGSRFYRLKN